MNIRSIIPSQAGQRAARPALKPGIEAEIANGCTSWEKKPLDVLEFRVRVRIDVLEYV